MKTEKQTTIAQERAAYRRTVEAVLIEFFETSPQSARKIVGDWWKRLSKTTAYKTGIFLHAEPLHSATELLDTHPLRLTLDQREKYTELVQASSPAVQKHSSGNAKPQANRGVNMRAVHDGVISLSVKAAESQQIKSSTVLKHLESSKTFRAPKKKKLLLTATAR